MDTLRSTQIIIMISTRRIHAEVACPHPHVVYGWINYGLTGGCVVAYAAVWIVAVQVQAHSGHGTGSQPQTPPAYPYRVMDHGGCSRRNGAAGGCRSSRGLSSSC